MLVFFCTWQLNRPSRRETGPGSQRTPSPIIIQNSVPKNAMPNACCLFLQEFLKRRLVNNHIPNRPESLPALLLLLQKLPPATDIRRVQFGQHILSEWLERLSRDNPVAYGRLYDNFKHLPVNVLLELGDPIAAQPVHLCMVDDPTDGVNRVLVDKELELD